MSTIVTLDGVSSGPPPRRTGRPPKPEGEKYTRISLTMHPRDLAEFDRERGEVSRGAYSVTLRHR